MPVTEGSAAGDAPTPKVMGSTGKKPGGLKGLLKGGLMKKVQAEAKNPGMDHGAPVVIAEPESHGYALSLPVPVFKRKIMGDVFGVTERMHAEGGLNGLMYRSRVQATEMESLRAIGKGEAPEAVVSKEKKASSVSDDISVFEDNSDDEPEAIECLNSRQQLALTIRNWTSLPENDLHLIEEGAVHALIGLATMDDNFIKKCCARALNQLSSRPENREKLLSLGAATGVIQIAMSVRVWKIAKLCALTLCNLSMYQNGEAVMAKDGAILALVILLGLKGHRLLPICSQALYNITCVKEHFKGVERTVKAFLSMPTVGAITDTSLCFLKSLVNCCRFSWIRMRLIEDGCMGGMTALLPALAERDPANRDEIVLLLATASRLLSESVGCRIELLAKGALDILKAIVPYCNDVSRVMAAKALYNIIQHPLSNAQFDTSANIAVNIAMLCDNHDPVVLELAAACFHAFTGQALRGNISLANMIMDAVPLCLGETAKPLTQFFSVTTAGNLFFMKDTDSRKLEILIEKVISMGDTLTDAEAMEALTVALAKLSQDDFSMAILERRGLFDNMLKLIIQLLAGTETKYFLAQESCAIAICRISLKLGLTSLTQDRKQAIVEGLMGLLQSDNMSVLSSTISSIRALGDVNICIEEFMQYKKVLFARLADVVKVYGDGQRMLCRNCCALLATFSYITEAHEALSQDDVMEVLFITTKSDDKFTRETVAITICNMTMSQDAGNRLINSGVCGIIATLSGATSEDIQQLCAKCICNLTCCVDLQKDIISHGVLQTILLIALVRTVEDKTKMLCARAIMNMISDDNIDSLKEAGVIRVFASIAAVLNHTTQNQCAQGFLIFSTTEERRDDVCSRKPVMQALFLMVKSTSPLCRILVGMTVCNLLSCEGSQKAAISAGALQVLKIISTMEYPQLREASARVIISLMKTKSLHAVLLRTAPIVPMLNYILHNSNTREGPSKVESPIGENVSISGDIFDCAVNAMSCVAQSEEFRDHVYASDGVQALVMSVLSGKVKSIDTATEVIRTFCLLSYGYDSTPILMEGQVMLACLYLYRKGLVVPKSAEMICIIIRNCATVPQCREELINSGAILLMRGVYKPMVDRSIAIGRSIIIAVLEFSFEEENHDAMIQHGVMEMVFNIAFPVVGDRTESDKLFPVTPMQLYHAFKHNEAYEKAASAAPAQPFELSNLDIERLAAACKNLSKSQSVHDAMVQGNFIGLVDKFINGNIEDKSRKDIAEALCNISSSKSCRQPLVDMGAVPLLLRISKDTTNVVTQSSCTVTLGYLSEMTIVDTGAVSSLLDLADKKEDEYTEPEKSKPKTAITGADTAEEGGALGEHTNTEGSTAEFNTGTESDAMAGVGHMDGSTGGKKKDEKAGSAKSLRQMIRSGLLSNKNKQILSSGGRVVNGVMVQNRKDAEIDEVPKKSKKGAHSMLVGRLRNITAHDMNSVDSLNREKEGLNHNYSKYSYRIFDNSGSFGVETGGIAVKHTTFLPLPQVPKDSQRGGDVPADRGLGLADAVHGKEDHAKDRASNLTKLPISQESLEKDTGLIDIDAISAALDLKESDEREAAAQLLLEEPDKISDSASASGRVSPTQMGDNDGPYTPGGGSGKKANRKSKIVGSGRASIHTKTVTGAGNAWGPGGGLQRANPESASPNGKERVRRQTSR